MIGKFKVWDSEEKEWVTIHSDWYLSSDGILLYNYRGSIIAAPSKFIPIYSTGKTDKNGVELFDGDIWELTDGDEWVIGVLVAGINEETFATDDRCLGKRLGNKFENPELMETK